MKNSKRPPNIRTSKKKMGRIYVPILLFMITGIWQLAVSQSDQASDNIPSKRIYHSMLYHTKADRILLFGSQSRLRWGADLKEIWSYDVKNNIWKEEGIYEASAVKDNACAHSPTYDIESDRVVVLNSEGETWAYDFKADKFVVFGGEIERPYSNKPINETWVFDPVQKEWQKK